MTEPWHYTTWLDALDHWQAFIAGILGFAAAIIVVLVTLRIERRKADRELDALRKSLAVELRLMVANALGTYHSLMKRVLQKDAVTYRALTYLFRVPNPIIYPATADKIGLLGPDAMYVVVIYNLVQTAREGVASLEGIPLDRIPPESIAIIAQSLLQACEQSRPILKKLRTGDPAHDKRDDELIAKISAASAEATKISNPTIGAE
jgi:hypothetical protein